MELLCAGMVGVVPAKVAAALPQGSGKAVIWLWGQKHFPALAMVPDMRPSM